MNLKRRRGKVHRHVGAGEIACHLGWGPIFGSVFPGRRGLDARLADPDWSQTSGAVTCRACLRVKAA